MTYCLGIVTKSGLVMASDSRTNAGYDQVNICRKMHTFEVPGERAFVLWAGLKGAVPILLGTFLLTAGVPDATRLYAVIVVVVAFSVIVQAAWCPSWPGDWACRCAPSNPDRGAWGCASGTSPAGCAATSSHQAPPPTAVRSANSTWARTHGSAC